MGATVPHEFRRGHELYPALPISRPDVGFALSPDASKLAIGGPQDGIRCRLGALGRTFKTNKRRSCHLFFDLEAIGVFACGSIADAFTAGLSPGRGKNLCRALRARKVFPAHARQTGACSAGLLPVRWANDPWMSGVAATLRLAPNLPQLPAPTRQRRSTRGAASTPVCRCGREVGWLRHRIRAMPISPGPADRAFIPRNGGLPVMLVRDVARRTLLWVRVLPSASTQLCAAGPR